MNTTTTTANASNATDVGCTLNSDCITGYCIKGDCLEKQKICLNDLRIAPCRDWKTIFVKPSTLENPKSDANASAKMILLLLVSLVLL